MIVASLYLLAFLTYKQALALPSPMEREPSNHNSMPLHSPYHLQSQVLEKSHLAGHQKQALSSASSGGGIDNDLPVENISSSWPRRMVQPSQDLSHTRLASHNHIAPPAHQSTLQQMPRPAASPEPTFENPLEGFDAEQIDFLKGVLESHEHSAEKDNTRFLASSSDSQHQHAIQGASPTFHTPSSSLATSKEAMPDTVEYNGSTSMATLPPSQPSRKRPPPTRLSKTAKRLPANAFWKDVLTYSEKTKLLTIIREKSPYSKDYVRERVPQAMTKSIADKIFSKDQAQVLEGIDELHLLSHKWYSSWSQGMDKRKRLKVAQTMALATNRSSKHIRTTMSKKGMTREMADTILDSNLTDIKKIGFENFKLGTDRRAPRQKRKEPI